MKRTIVILLWLLSLNTFGQTCTILSKANDIAPDRLCSPVTATWKVTYTGVNDAGTPVSIRYDWNNGSVVIVPATQIGPGVFEATAINTYTSAGNVCNYHPQATLIVNGILCTSSTQEQIVTVWDADDYNGGRMHINPLIWPICFGNGDNARFQDLTLFNCVPPQERDNPNVNTRWIQWIYGTDITMTGIPITINGQPQTFPYNGDIIILSGPVTGSGVWSDTINIANDKLVGQYFQVTLRNWNYCNPYDDPSIPGEPRDTINGDHPPVVTTAIILIVPYPDATINPVSPMCSNALPVTLTAHDPGGHWTGNGVVGNTFNPNIAGVGDHIIRYDITNANNCSASDTVMIHVMESPDASITPVPIVCFDDPPFILVAHDTGGVWSGNGVIGDMFHPSVAGYGNHLITYNITNTYGCIDTDHQIIPVVTPDATINPVDTLCMNDPPVILTAHDMGGIWTGPGVIGNTFHPSQAGAGNHLIIYTLNNPDCTDTDSTIITVMPIPTVMIEQIGTVYINHPPIQLNALPLGGTWSGPGVTGNIFNPRDARLGTHVITYITTIDQYGCSNFDTIHIQVLLPPLPTAYWLPDTAGCTPLTVPFRNLSTDAEVYLWDFGDRTYSTEENPTHTYYVPGNYIVRLTATNIVGSSTHQGIINVFQSPTAIFGAYPTNVINNEQIVVFHSYSYYAVSYLWDFGDAITSTDENPYHKYENEGTYTVTLWVTSKDGCVDSTKLDTPIIVDWKIGSLKYPNAFKWNETGPTGGYWREGVYPEMDFVFRPIGENVDEYRLQIFNRWGTLIYESYEYYKGWDGYDESGNLCVQGVYVWKATGIYVDGESFNKVGDVTFLH